ncbi:UDP-N-acetylmuramate dehydrogenase [Candidatus Endomicrobiellum agilis]|uniref:UDP-N-acetylmuramate dehydrogenase n=1 Tax=Candidatus Endomicrobiellum agilis TaxID=3238957 RepID=UPI00357F2DCF|nr:UDP-N-acetylmuramate dehydrogenase [Endomicrobium sp.]
MIKTLSSFGCKILKDEPLSKYCSFKIGGPADFFIEILNEQALLEFLKVMSGGKFYVLSGGTNVLFSDKGYRGAIIRLAGDFRKISVLKNEISCGSGVLLSDVLKIALENDLVGLEYMAGIPGTVGGAVYGNTGSKDEWISAAIKTVEVYKNLRKELVNKEEIVFGYRKSGLENCIISKVNFSLKKDTKNGSLKKISENIRKRLETQPLNMPNAGSIFKNPNGFSVGKLIEEAGLKGKCVGGAQISKLHGNFIVNTGGALAKDVLTLIDLVKERIKEKFSIDLETEIKIIK